MQKNNGYTIPELIIVAVVVGIFASIAITKASYSFDNNEIGINEETQNMILIKGATAYAESIQDRLINEKVIYVSTSELEAAGYLADATDYQSWKIRITYDEATTSIMVDIIK